ncbi:major capsid protein [robinz microvirus RP_171]|nr:major capsid protein [robinz microvirus RP_171]
MNPFQSTSSRRPESSKFDLSHNRKFSFKPGYLYPILVTEAIPSDVWNYDCNAVVRMAPMLSPVMHMVDVCVHSFFYPERLTQKRGYFETFITGGSRGDGKASDGTTVECPYFVVTGDPSSSAAAISIPERMGEGSLADFLGIHVSNIAGLGAGTQRINARPFIAFWRIYTEYFRDQNVQFDPTEVYTVPGANIFDSPGGDMTAAIYAAITAVGEFEFQFFELPRVCWDKDYFTSALPFAQRGEAVEAPLTGSATITYKDVSEVFRQDGGLPFATDPLKGSDTGELLTNNSVNPNEPGRIENLDEITLNAGGFTITALRTAARLQEWLEKMATGGARYIEQIKAQFGVTSSDARLQRAEYLGGGKIPMHINEVVQSSADDATPLAEMAGHGVTAGNVTNFKKFVEEHGYFLTFIYLRPKPAYQQGLPRMFFNRFDKLDYAWPSFARIGEQEILRKELWFSLNPTFDEGVFGYQQRYAEYKYLPSTVHGEFQSTLNHWQWGRIFDSPPALSAEFVQCDPSDRIFNILGLGTDSLYCIVNNRITARRPLPYYGEPTL